MEFPSFNHHHHHHNRYAPPPPPPPTNFSDDRPNLYPHHQHLLPPPPPLAYPSLPPPPPPPLPVPPPPPSYNPHQSHFTFLDAQNPSFLNHGRSSPPQPRFSNRFDYRTDSWSDSHRVPPEPSHRNPILPDDHHRRLYSPDSRSENRYKPSSRYRDETYINVLTSRDASSIVSQEQQVFRGTSNNDEHHGRYASAQPVASNSRNLDDFVDKYEPRYITSSENERVWDHHGDDTRRIHQMKGKKNEFGHNDGALFVSGREQSQSQSQSRDYEYEPGRVTRSREGRDGREGREEFKQVQKKSVLLRIGKPNNTNRNRSHDQHFSRAHTPESNNSNYRGKDKDRDHASRDSSLSVDHRDRMEGDREHSPVELDVSFKSNALVAKAVVTPSSPVIDNNNTQFRNKKSKRAIEFDSPLRRSGSSSNGLDCPSSSEKAPKQQKVKGSNGLDCPSSSEKAPKQQKIKDPGYDGAPVLGQGVASGGSVAPLSFRLKKKRKVINFKNSPSVSIFQLAEKDSKAVKGENKNSPSPSVQGAIPFTLEEPLSSKVEDLPQAMVSEKDGSEVEKVSIIIDGLVNDLSQQSSQNDVSLNLENNTKQVLTDAKVSLDGTRISASSGQDQIEIEKCPTVPFASFDACSAESITVFPENLNNVSVKIQEMSNTACSDKIISLVPENGNTVGSLDGVSRKKEETLLLKGTVFLENGPEETPNVIANAEDNAVLTGKSYKGSDFQSELTTSGEIHENLVAVLQNVGPTRSSSIKAISSDEDEIVEIVELNSESAETRRLDHRESMPEDEIVEIVELNSESVETQRPDHTEHSTDEAYLLLKDDLPSSSNILSTCPDDKSGEPMPDMSIVSSKKASGFPKDQMISISNSGIPNDDGDICKKIVLEDGGLLNCPDTSVERSKTSIKPSHLEVSSLLANTKTTTLTSQGLNTKMQGSSLPTKKPNSASTVPTVFATRSSAVFTNSRINNPSKSIAKPRTWHRSVNNTASISVPRPLKQIGTVQNAYIRSGNTLVRKGSPVTTISSVPPASRSSIYQLNPSGPIETRDSTYSRTGAGSSAVVRPKTPPLSGGTKLPDSTTIRVLPSSPLEVGPEDQNGTSSNSESQKTLDEGTVGKKIEYVKPKSNQLVAALSSDKSVQELDKNGTSSNLESQKTLDEGTAGKKIEYVKPKSNQLVAASSSDKSVQELDKTQALSSDGYYKRRKNQLIRTLVGNDSVNTDVRKVAKINSKRQSGKGMSKKYRNSRFSSVWTLGAQSLGKEGVSLRQKLRPHLFPWKRSKYWGNVVNVSPSIHSNSSPSLISRKLLASRKREMIYTRSKHGFSLRMSKLLSVGGSSLKWSKSIEKNSKRANEEATLAVAAAEKKRREQNLNSEIKSRTNNMSSKSMHSKRQHPGDRIFRIGLVRYKMDPSRRTLQRISDEEPSTSKKSKEEIRRSYVPKRLLIGHDEYLRIGNGNQLVRNLKRRTRLFANEKVRWSLHTARSRLARKKKYCQFFTRFGKCNKDDGKCQYIHDSSKIAVCTKFLKGLCSNPDCKLTHKVIPERMQDCSYFLQGLCSNEHCPYRHVNVNSAASICEGFLKGYCADGNECRKKHTYACPAFEATGECSQGTNCKLHHPKNRNTGLKRKQQNTTGHQKNSRGRYFGAVSGGDAMPVSEIHHIIDDDRDISCQQGKFAEYISLDFGNEEFGDVISDQRAMVYSEPLDLGEADLDELIKPIGLMKKFNSIVPDLHPT